MAEALAGLSIAANVMQVIGFSYDTISICRKIYRNTSLAPEEATINIQSIHKVSDNLRIDLASTLPQTVQHQELHAVATQILRLTENIEAELEACQVPKGTSKIKKFMKTSVKSLKYNVSSKTKVDEMESRLNALQNTMQTQILVDLRRQIKEQNLTSLDSFKNLDQNLQNFAKQLERGVTELKVLLGQESKAIQDKVTLEAEATRASNVHEATGVRHHVSKEIQITRQQMQFDRIDDFKSSNVESFLKSLYFPEMNARANQLNGQPQHSGTFQWVFGVQDEIKDGKYDSHVTPTWDDFSEWLQDDRPIYWISGKPGSGKSTFMQFLIHNPRTIQLLEKQGYGTCTIAAYIWTAGSLMQRSLQGLLCMLLYAFVSQMPSLVEKIGIDRRTWNKRTPDDWSLQELEHTFNNLVKKHAQPVCVFIDGLDEIDSGISNGQMKLLDLIKGFSTLDGIKLCVSSRPEPVLETQLCEYPHLRLQDLNRKDILHLVYGKLNNTTMTDWIERQLDMQIHDPDMDQNPKPSLQNLVKVITDRADGMFLWVCLVTQGIQNGIIARDDWKILMRHVNLLPRELETLYEDLWKRQQGNLGIYRQHTASYLHILLHDKTHDSITLLMLFITEPALRQRLLGGGKYVSSAELYIRLQEFQRQVVARCCGLVEVNFINSQPNRRDPSSGSESDFTNQFFRSAAKFTLIHRSAKDFLKDSAKGKEICSHDHKTSLEQKSDQFLARVAFLVVFGRSDRALDLTMRYPGSHILEGPETTYYVRSLSLNLVEASLQRDPEQEKHLIKPLEAAVRNGHFDVGMHLLTHIYQERTRKETERYTRLLILSLSRMSVPDRPSGSGQNMIKSLLQHEADPNSIVTPFGEYLYNLPPLVTAMSSTKSIDTDFLRESLQTLWRHRLDPTVRFISCLGYGHQRLAFPQRRADAIPGKLLYGPEYITVLVDTSYSHMWSARDRDRQMELLFLKDGNTENDFEEFIRDLFDDKRAAKPRYVMLVKVTVNEGDDAGKIVSGLAGKLIVSEQHFSHFLEHWTLDDSVNLSSKQAVIPGRSVFFDSYEGEILDEVGILEWLVEQKYMSPSALNAKDPLRMLVKSHYLPPEFEYPHDRSKVDYSYRPEYDLFVKAVDECVAAGFGDIGPYSSEEEDD